MEPNLIALRRREVEQEIERVKSRLSDLSAELVELDTAERVIARLTGAKWRSPREADQPEPTRISRENPLVKAPPMPLRIEAVLRQAHDEGLPGLEPKQMVKRIGQKWIPEPKGEYVSSIAWRMWKRGQLEKDENSPLYRLPGKEKAADGKSGQDAPAALFDQPSAQGG